MLTPGLPGTLERSLVARRQPGAAPAGTRSATRFVPLSYTPRVAHACQTGPLRENTDPPTTGNP
ncbi:hypothetical protein D1006_08430 [Burkholderia stabilis]|uniref:Uncharacterized protein n=1 Tax=Burkholderia stabilis TaxID=95485 RepID=A0A4V1PSV0_9BURK|nr:hypothetical protein D1006_08430 [Burkholderia stabilis]